MVINYNYKELLITMCQRRRFGLKITRSTQLLNYNLKKVRK